MITFLVVALFTTVTPLSVLFHMKYSPVNQFENIQCHCVRVQVEVFVGQVAVVMCR